MYSLKGTCLIIHVHSANFPLLVIKLHKIVTKGNTLAGNTVKFGP